MNAFRRPRSLVGILLTVLTVAAAAVPARASHSWGTYHWARRSNPFTINVIDSMTPDWDDNLSTGTINAIADWSATEVLDAQLNGHDDSTKARKRCAAVSGQVRSCNATYGPNGWLGLAQIWLSGDHIVQGTAKMNDTYLASSSYSETNRQHVICQEIGHDWGLGHTSEDGSDQNTCMDYSRDLGNPSPNAHDTEQLNTMYSHLDDSTTISALPADVANADLRAPAEWGRLVHQAGRSAVYERDFGRVFKIITHVLWVDEHAAHRH